MFGEKGLRCIRKTNNAKPERKTNETQPFDRADADCRGFRRLLHQCVWRQFNCDGAEQFANSLSRTHQTGRDNLLGIHGR